MLLLAGGIIRDFQFGPTEFLQLSGVLTQIYVGHGVGDGVGYGVGYGVGDGVGHDVGHGVGDGVGDGVGYDVNCYEQLIYNKLLAN